MAGRDMAHFVGHFTPLLVAVFLPYESVSPAVLRGEDFNIGQTVLPNVFIPAFTNLDLAWGPQDQRKTKHIGFISSCTFDPSRMKSDMVMKQLKLKFLRLLLSKIY